VTKNKLLFYRQLVPLHRLWINKSYHGKMTSVYIEVIPMTINKTDNKVCEACGCAGEIGFVIKEGDEVSEVQISAENEQQLESELNKYVTLSKQVCASSSHEVSHPSDDKLSLVARFQFEVSAEKIIFEMKARSLR